MKIVTLVENYVANSYLKSEHGLSIYIEDDDGTSILFDAGLSDICIENALALKIDIGAIDHFVLSHGHIDHSGGLPRFLKLNENAQLHIGSGALLSKYYRNINVGIPTIDDHKHRIACTEVPIQLSKHVTLIPRIAITNWTDTHFEDLKVGVPEALEDDQVGEEQFLLIRKNEKQSIVTGCSHRGISNLLQTAHDFSDLPFDMIIGGFHLFNATPKQFEAVEQSLEIASPRRIGVSHCTGLDAYAQLRSKFGDRVFYNQTGTTLEL